MAAQTLSAPDVVMRTRPAEVHDRLDSASLGRLARGEGAVIWHRGYVDAAVLAPAARAAFEAAGAPRPAGNQPASYGATMAEALWGGADGRDRYLAAAFRETRVLRDRVFAPYLSPLDRVRLELDELWPGGAAVARMDGRPMSAGTVRHYVAGDRMNPHVDGNSGEVLAELCRECRIAVNIYLDVPPPGAGGELELWNLALTPEEANSPPRPGYRLPDELLGDADVVIRPAAGDLVMFDTSRIHAVRAVREGTRTTASCFVGVRGPREPLTLFS
ncbi:MAG TPA: 2OG-Fe(II) oxygenase [Longimicrobium sp.]|nr:2OG-Fe(II) oxygenase [Longimicrobium sp.]